MACDCCNLPILRMSCNVDVTSTPPLTLQTLAPNVMAPVVWNTLSLALDWLDPPVVDPPPSEIVMPLDGIVDVTLFDFDFGDRTAAAGDVGVFIRINGVIYSTRAGQLVPATPSNKPTALGFHLPVVMHAGDTFGILASHSLPISLEVGGVALWFEYRRLGYFVTAGVN